MLNQQAKEKKKYASQKFFLHQWKHSHNLWLQHFEREVKGIKEVAEVHSRNNNKRILQNTSPKETFVSIISPFLYTNSFFIITCFFCCWLFLYVKQRHKFGTQINQSSRRERTIVENVISMGYKQ